MQRRRERFDRLVEQVLAELPPWVIEYLDETPLIVEDRPSATLMREMDLECPDELCGLYDGLDLTKRSSHDSGLLPSQITIFRRGIVAQAADDRGRVSTRSLLRQIRITILHEIGHHHGLDEDDLSELGYD